MDSKKDSKKRKKRKTKKRKMTSVTSMQIGMPFYLMVSSSLYVIGVNISVDFLTFADNDEVVEARAAIVFAAKSNPNGLA